jgi:hypothetical protein
MHALRQRSRDFQLSNLEMLVWRDSRIYELIIWFATLTASSCRITVRTGLRPLSSAARLGIDVL